MDVTLNMKFLEHCEPGELVRAHFGLKVEWGIVADRQQQKRVVVISGNNAPWYLDPARRSFVMPKLRKGI